MWREENTMLMNSNEYLHIVESIKREIRTAQYRAAVSVNRELLVLYHSIGEVINAHKTWGSKFVENLAADIKLSFPDATGYSARNLKYMAKFAAAYPGRRKFVHDLLHKFRGDTMLCCWTSFPVSRNAYGMQREVPRTGGLATCWFIKSKAACYSGRCWRKKYPTLKIDCHPAERACCADHERPVYL